MLQNRVHLRQFIWLVACITLLPVWGNVFISSDNVYWGVFYSAWASFAIFTLVLASTFYLQNKGGDDENMLGLYQQAHNQARLYQSQLNALLIMSPDGIVAFDAQQRVQLVNPAFLRMTGLTESQLLGIDHLEFTRLLATRCVSPAIFGGVDALKQSIARQRIELSGAGKFVLQVELVRASNALDSLEAPLSMLLYFRDITSDSQLEQDKTDFLATAAHELRTPMASVYGFSEVLLMQDNDPEAQREFLGIIYRQAEHMVKIINDLLDLARIEARQSRDFVFERLTVQDEVREVVRQFKIPEGRSSPELNFPQEDILIRADAVKFRQAMQNVLSNAYKYSPAGGSVQVTVQLHSVQEVSISIRDSGIGMTENQIKQVFTRFYRAETVTALPGTGLGMNIVKEIMRLHSGDVLIDSELGVGTRVSLILPVHSE